MVPVEESWLTLVTHTGDSTQGIESHSLNESEQATQANSQCFIRPEDQGRVAAWAQAVEVDGTPEHYHRRSAELYYVLEGEGQVLLDGQVQPLRPGTIVHIPPGVIHATRGRMRMLVVGVPVVAEDDTYFLDEL